MQDMVERLANSRDDQVPGVKSAFARPAIRGFVYVEASFYNDVKLVCERAHGYRGDIQLVSIDDAEAALTLKPFDFSVEKGSWVRLARGTYKGDLAFVQDLRPSHYDGKHKNAKAIVVLKVIPRIRYFDESVLLLSVKRKRDARPTAALFDPVRWQNGVDKVKAVHVRDGLTDSTQVKLPKLPKLRKLQGAEAAGEVWKLHDNIFKNGLREMEVPINALNFRPTIPFYSELRLWIQCLDPIVQNSVKRHLRSCNHIWIGDRIRVTRGDVHLDRQGTVQSVDEEEVSVFLCPWAKAGRQALAAEEATIPIVDVQKIFFEGDFVEVMENGVASKTGWVVNVDGKKIIISQQTAPDVSD
jgi:transcription elongation factor SPT5